MMDNRPSAADLQAGLIEIVYERARMLLARDDIEGDRTSPASRSQDERRVQALARLRACTETTAELQQIADFHAVTALSNRASYAELGAARGVSRQAARQWHRKRLAQNARRRAAAEAEHNLYENNIDDDEDQSRWPPRQWRFRAPAGYRTVRLAGGPADSQTMRVPVGDDAFPFVDHYDVFGTRHARHARYTATDLGSEDYRFTGEYFVRWQPPG